MHDGSAWAIVIYVAICAINGAGLAIDEVLMRNGLGTISEYIRANKAWGIPIIALQMIATVALAWHFWAPQPPPKVVTPGTPNQIAPNQPER